MNNIIFLIFRRMRAPLLILVLAYSVAMLGLVLIPGRDGDGNVYYMDFLHAFYFVSYMSSTIGFGELPYPFTAAQRLWVTLSIFFTVVVWLYSIGTVLALLKDETFQKALTERRFARKISKLREPFYLVSGYGQTGEALVKALTDRSQHAVVIDILQERVNLLKLENLREYVPGLCADARLPEHLLEAGLKHPLCEGVVALTNSNETNLKIAITAKLLHPDIEVICRADSHDIEKNMASFGTDYIIDPFDAFALYLATAIQAPCLSLMQDWLSLGFNDLLSDPIHPPKKGLWVVCGYGRFGKAVYDKLVKEDLEVVVIEADPSQTGTPQTQLVVGRGTEADTLTEASIERAVGLVAGTDNDANNLSIIMTARELNPDLFVILRQNRKYNDPVIQAVGADMVMLPSDIIANRIRVLLGVPMQHQFVRLAMHQDDEWACQLISRISALVTEHAPDVWEVAFTEQDTHAVCQYVREGRNLTLGELSTDPRDRTSPLPCIPLMLLRHNDFSLLPGPDLVVQKDDRLLFCGRVSAKHRMEWTLQNENALNYILTGETRPQGWIWRRLQKREVT
ncbi:MAG: NAD-binding protein [Candidatus Thiodiazotropha sp. (ex. Lucinisca nassula)]|nr:NAD-binding protein [Candidatus Thiodiazotropha sp. (ex. Lucinisca nassula)]MBW9263822.1 NAD-binding protein [Candidatus Thiodiazotropha sp. (ex. Lucinisca nassula)]MBW9268824.1 NAD-binding protein [Candidatus Thiodiazotropha sp. (ex. Lucinisca nassula)]